MIGYKNLSKEKRQLVNSKRFRSLLHCVTLGIYCEYNKSFPEVSWPHMRLVMTRASDLKLVMNSPYQHHVWRNDYTLPEPQGPGTDFPIP